MKKTILGLMPLLVASMLIAGCGKKASSSSAPASSSEAPASSSSEAQSYTAAEVIWEIDQNLFGDEAEEADIATSEQSGITFYRIKYVAYFDETAYTQADATEEFLNAAFNDEILTDEVLPSYLSLVEGPTFAENSQQVSETEYVNSSLAFYATPKQDVAVGVRAYIHPAVGYLVYSFYAYDVPAQS